MKIKSEGKTEIECFDDVMGKLLSVPQEGTVEFNECG